MLISMFFSSKLSACDAINLWSVHKKFPKKQYNTCNYFSKMRILNFKEKGCACLNEDLVRMWASEKSRFHFEILERSLLLLHLSLCHHQSNYF